MDNFWHARDQVTLKYDDKSNVVVDYVIPGLARRVGQDWEISLQPWGNDSVTWADGTLRCVAVVDTNFGARRREVTFSFPDLIDEPRLTRRDKATVSLRAPAVREASTATADFGLEVTPQIMACMSKSYGYEKFAKLWLARTTLKNTGDQVVTDFRVRFRLGEYAPDWSPWSRTASVYPGQTVVDAYFPLMNTEKIAAVQGRRQAVLEAEYEYRLASGQVVRDVEGHKLEILGRNERIKSNLSLDEAKTMLDLNVFTPFIMASFVTKDDKMIQMAAGRISGQVAGLSPSANPEHAIEYVRQIHRFLLHNKIAYQTPPGTGAVQHYKYGRDVLTNRAGTCVDLAIFYASVCEAVGLEPVMCTPPGHAFPMIRLPAIAEPADAKPGTTPNRNAFLARYGAIVVEYEGQLYLPFEATCLDPKVSFEQAAAIAKKTRLAMKPPLLQFDIAALRRDGVYALELPEPPANAFDHLSAAPAGREPAKARPLGEPAKLILGTWRADVVVGGQQLYILGTFKDDGTIEATIFSLQNQPLSTGGGKWTLEANGAYHFSGAFEEDAVITFRDENTYSYKCVKSTNPLAVPGAVVMNRRVK